MEADPGICAARLRKWSGLWEVLDFYFECGADVEYVLDVVGRDGTRESLKYKLLGAKGGMDAWGGEYVKNLSGEIGSEWQQRKTDDKPTDDLKELVDAIVPFNVKHNSEPEACDILMEVDAVADIIEHAHEANFQRISLYLTQCAR
jgi:26S proteasome regulatory subunit N1